MAKSEAEALLQKRAHWITTKALRFRQIRRSDRCEWCGKNCPTVAHHEDYSRPLSIVWLCPPCHSIRHANMRRGPYPAGRNYQGTTNKPQKKARVVKIRRLTVSENRARADEADDLRALLAIHLGDVANAAASLGWPVRTLYHRLKALGIKPGEYREKTLDPPVRCAECGGTEDERKIKGCSGVLHSEDPS